MERECSNQSLLCKLWFEASAFYRAGSHTFDDVLLAEEIEDDDRDDAHEDERHRGAEVDGAVAALEVLNMNRDRAVLVDIQHERREQR